MLFCHVNYPLQINGTESIASINQIFIRGRDFSNEQDQKKGRKIKGEEGSYEGLVQVSYQP